MTVGNKCRCYVSWLNISSNHHSVGGCCAQAYVAGYLAVSNAEFQVICTQFYNACNVYAVSHCAVIVTSTIVIGKLASTTGNTERVVSGCNVIAGKQVGPFGLIDVSTTTSTSKTDHR